MWFLSVSFDMLYFMRSPIRFTILLALVLGIGLPAFSVEPAGEELQHINSVARRLGDSHFLVRQAASKQLVHFGESALPAIRQVAADNTNRELQFRARHVIRKIMLVCGQSQSTGLKTVIIEAGDFQMGSPLDEAGRKAEEILHDVQISHTFLLGTYEVTQGQFEEVMEFAPSHFTRKSHGKEKVRRLDTSDFPVEQVSWFDSISFCNRLSARDGYRPYYRMTDIEHDGKSITHATVVVDGGNGYRLPTEAEWEYACRASSRHRFHFGVKADNRKANLQSRTIVVYGSSINNSLKRAAKTGSYKPNAWGLYDMHGNVAEWCWDWYGEDYYVESLRQDPQGPDSGRHRVVRGGSWLLNESGCRSASRFYLTADQCKYFAGFRVARTP